MISQIGHRYLNAEISPRFSETNTLVYEVNCRTKTLQQVIY